MVKIKIFDIEKTNFDIAKSKIRRYYGGNKSAVMSRNHKTNGRKGEMRDIVHNGNEAR
ncbi:MAG TPA: hypothetical protein GXX75_15095 [Clostridiales bacterium]|nr:hypothetical protein [Clostridiales bacterium]